MAAIVRAHRLQLAKPFLLLVFLFLLAAAAHARIPAKARLHAPTHAGHTAAHTGEAAAHARKAAAHAREAAPQSARPHLLHHGAHFLEVADQLAHFFILITSSTGDAPPSTGGTGEQFRIFALLLGHGIDHGLDPPQLRLALLQLVVGNFTRHPRNHLHDAAQGAHVFHQAGLFEEVVEVELRFQNLGLKFFLRRRCQPLPGLFLPG